MKRRGSGIKARIRTEKERERRIAIVVMSLTAIAIIFVSSFAVYRSIKSMPAQAVGSVLKAAIVDQLSLSIPNQTFVQAAKDMLTKAGYAVDYYSGEEVTVEFYRKLATYGYKLIILRVHSALGSRGDPPLALFTSELYSTSKYLTDQLYGRVTMVVFDPEVYGDSNPYFGITPDFIRYSVDGKFNDAVIIMMGCNGIPYLGSHLRYIGMAKAFIDKGAKVYIGWSGPVLGSHSDAATMCLLHKLLVEKQWVRRAVEETMREVGLDPMYRSQLQFYPFQAENVKIN